MKNQDRMCETYGMSSEGLDISSRRNELITTRNVSRRSESFNLVDSDSYLGNIEDSITAKKNMVIDIRDGDTGVL